MAYRKPITLTCPECGLSGRVVSVVHVGPNSNKSDGPPHKSILDAGPFEKSGNTLSCPTDGTRIWPKQENSDDN